MLPLLSIQFNINFLYSNICITFFLFLLHFFASRFLVEKIFVQKNMLIQFLAVITSVFTHPNMNTLNAISHWTLCYLFILCYLCAQEPEYDSWRIFLCFFCFSWKYTWHEKSIHCIIYIECTQRMMIIRVILHWQTIHLLIVGKRKLPSNKHNVACLFV